MEERSLRFPVLVAVFGCMTPVLLGWALWLLPEAPKPFRFGPPTNPSLWRWVDQYWFGASTGPPMGSGMLIDRDIGSIPEVHPDADVRGRSVRVVGWPAFCLAGGRDLNNDTSVRDWGLISFGGQRAAGRPFDSSLPIFPLGRGLAFDVVFWVLGWWVLLGGPLLVRRVMQKRRRARMGLCRNCGYDLSGTPGRPCPECGQTPEPVHQATPTPV